MNIKEFEKYVEARDVEADSRLCKPWNVYVCTRCEYIDKPGLCAVRGICPECGEKMGWVTGYPERIVAMVNSEVGRMKRK